MEEEGALIRRVFPLKSIDVTYHMKELADYEKYKYRSLIDNISDLKDQGLPGELIDYLVPKDKIISKRMILKFLTLKRLLRLDKELFQLFRGLPREIRNEIINFLENDELIDSILEKHYAIVNYKLFQSLNYYLNSLLDLIDIFSERVDKRFSLTNSDNVNIKTIYEYHIYEFKKRVNTIQYKNRPPIDVLKDLITLRDNLIKELNDVNTLYRFTTQAIVPEEPEIRELEPSDLTLEEQIKIAKEKEEEESRNKNVTEEIMKGAGLGALHRPSMAQNLSALIQKEEKEAKEEQRKERKMWGIIFSIAGVIYACIIIISVLMARYKKRLRLEAKRKEKKP